MIRGGGCGEGGIVILASYKKHFMSVCENLLQCPHILHPLLKGQTSVHKLMWPNFKI